MNDTKLYEQVLGDIRPWRVERVTLNREAMAIDAYSAQIGHPFR